MGITREDALKITAYSNDRLDFSFRDNDQESIAMLLKADKKLGRFLATTLRVVENPSREQVNGMLIALGLEVYFK